MKALKLVNVPSIQKPIQPSPGFAKKGLSDFKLDACGLCGFGCSYCSSNSGNYLRIRREPFAKLTRQQLGRKLYPEEEPRLMFLWPDFQQKLEAQLSTAKTSWGAGKTLVYSMLTDGFSPQLVKRGLTEWTLRQILEKTSLRIRVLTKNSVVGSRFWTSFFAEHRDRFVVGLSVGSLDNNWARQVELYTPPPTARLRALSKLQQAGVPTYGMLCPVFPDMLAGKKLEKLVDALQPAVVETVWAEPYNVRKNWMKVREGYAPGSYGYKWLTDVYENGRSDLWSSYATSLYVRLKTKAKKEGWLHKLRFLLYEDQITESDAKQFEGLGGVMLQSQPAADGRSKNVHIAKLQ